MKKRLRVSALIVLLFFSNPYLSNVALSLLETNPVVLKSEQFDYGIVLSGIVNGGYDVPNQDQLNENFDRLTEAIKLYKAGVINKVIISGGAADITYFEFNEGKSLVEITKVLGVDSEDIIWENKSRNTFENAKYTSELLLEGDESLLITSAFHMPRASRCFSKAGVNFSAYPVDYKGRKDFKLRYLLPSSDSFQNWNIVSKELVGLLVYRLVGYV